MRENIRRGTLKVSLALLFVTSPFALADVFDASSQGKITCSNFNLSDLFDISSLLNFTKSIGGCNLSTAGISTCQNKAMKAKTATEKLLGDGYRFVYPDISCGKKIASVPDFGFVPDLGGKKTTMNTAKWKESRYKNAVDNEDIDIMSRTASYVDPASGSIVFSGGATTAETNRIITRDASYSGIFSDGTDETFVSDISSQLNPGACKKSSASKSVACALGENMKLYGKTSDERDKLIDVETQRNTTLMEVAATPEKTLIFPTKEFSDRMSLDKQMRMTEYSNYVLASDALFRARAAAINNHRKAMSKFMVVKSALNATSKYPSLSQTEAKNTTAGDLP